MKFNKLDLNLLVALDILLKERSVSRTDEHLHLSSSELSNSLALLRDYFNDDLLVQIGRKLELTPRAKVLQESVREVLLHTESTIAAQPVFAPERSHRTFRIFASDYSQMILGPAIFTLASKAQATVRFEILPQVNAPYKSLGRGKADLLIITVWFTSPTHPWEKLFGEDFVCLVWQGSKLALEELTLERYVNAEHVVLKPADDRIDAFEGGFLKKVRDSQAHRGLDLQLRHAAHPGGGHRVRRDRARARRLAGARSLEVRSASVSFDGMEESKQWHKFHANGPGLAWLRGLLVEASRHIDYI
jgi:DNA-binding transcriptional LysR family regulator